MEHRAPPAAMSDVGETVRLEDVFDDVDAEMDYLMGNVSVPGYPLPTL